jgi:hypothetical protein
MKVVLLAGGFGTRISEESKKTKEKSTDGYNAELYPKWGSHMFVKIEVHPF